MNQRDRDIAMLNLPVVSSRSAALKGARRDIAELWAHRGLLRAFATREFRVRYKGATLGWLWSLARPLVMLAVYGLAIGVFLGAAKSIPDFAIYLFVGFTAWTLFSQIILGSIQTVTDNRELIKKVYFPREILIVAVVLVALVDLVIQWGVLVLGYALVRSWPEPIDLLWVPVALLVTVIWAIAFGLVLAAQNARLKDIAYVTDVALQVGFWLVPIVYTYNLVAQTLSAYPVLNWLYLANPMTNAIFAFRNGLWPPGSKATGIAMSFEGDLILRLAVLLVVGAVALFFAHRFFSRRSSNFAQEL